MNKFTLMSFYRILEQVISLSRLFSLIHSF